jgi:hypothetical protein
LLVTLAARVERAPPPAAFDFNLAFAFDFDVDLNPDLEAQPNHLTAPILPPSFLIARMILIFARVERTLLSVAFDFGLAFDFDFVSSGAPPQPAAALPRNTNGADRKACAAVFLTLYIQNIKLERANEPCSMNLYFPANQSFKQKFSSLGS